MFIVFSFLYTIPLSLTISAHTKPAPNSFTVRRNAELHTPAIGAKTTGFFISMSPIFNIGNLHFFILLVLSLLYLFLRNEQFSQVNPLLADDYLFQFHLK